MVGDLPEGRGCSPERAQPRPIGSFEELASRDEAASWQTLRTLLISLGYEELSAELARTSETLAEMGRMTGRNASMLTSNTCLSLSRMLGELSATLARRGEFLAQAERDSTRQD